MHYDQKVFVTQFLIVKWFVAHLTYYRTLSNGYKDHGLQNEFWTMTIDAHLIRATMHWCMVFGSDGCNPTHWKQLSKKQSKELAQSFREGLFETTCLDEKHWRQYWESMTKFRNKYAAHRELKEFTDPVPKFDTALAVAYYYDEWVREIICPDILDEPPLERFAKSLKESVTPLVDKLLGVTKDFSESQRPL